VAQAAQAARGAPGVPAQQLAVDEPHSRLVFRGARSGHNDARCEAAQRLNGVEPVFVDVDNDVSRRQGAQQVARDVLGAGDLGNAGPVSGGVNAENGASDQASAQPQRNQRFR
jgi:hypothetical protein